MSVNGQFILGMILEMLLVMEKVHNKTVFSERGPTFTYSVMQWQGMLMLGFCKADSYG